MRRGTPICPATGPALREQQAEDACLPKPWCRQAKLDAANLTEPGYGG